MILKQQKTSKIYYKNPLTVVFLPGTLERTRVPSVAPEARGWVEVQGTRGLDACLHEQGDSERSEPRVAHRAKRSEPAA